MASMKRHEKKITTNYKREREREEKFGLSGFQKTFFFPSGPNHHNHHTAPGGLHPLGAGNVDNDGQTVAVPRTAVKTFLETVEVPEIFSPLW